MVPTCWDQLSCWHRVCRQRTLANLLSKFDRIEDFDPVMVRFLKLGFILRLWWRIGKPNASVLPLLCKTMNKTKQRCLYSNLQFLLSLSDVSSAWAHCILRCCVGDVFVGSNIKPHFAPCFSSTNYVFALTQRWQEATGLQEDWRVRSGQWGSRSQKMHVLLQLLHPFWARLYSTWYSDHYH